MRNGLFDSNHWEKKIDIGKKGEEKKVNLLYDISIHFFKVMLTPFFLFSPRKCNLNPGRFSFSFLWKEYLNNLAWGEKKEGSMSQCLNLHVYLNSLFNLFNWMQISVFVNIFLNLHSVFFLLFVAHSSFFCKIFLISFC